MASITHVALRVTNLRKAESYYVGLFDLDVEFREAVVDGEWRTLPPDAGWDDAEHAGVDLDLCFLRRDDFALALERTGAVAPAGSLSHIGIELPRRAHDRLREVLDEFDCEIAANSDTTVVFVDAAGVTWEATWKVTADWTPRSTGDRTGRWIAV